MILDLVEDYNFENFEVNGEDYLKVDSDMGSYWKVDDD